MNITTFQKVILSLAVTGLIAANFLVFIPKASAQVPDEFRRCVPVVTDFKVNPLKLTKRDQLVTMSVTVQTNACIISQVNGVQPKWQVRAELVDDNGKYYEASFKLPQSGFMKGSDFKDMSTNPNSPLFNKYSATYSVSGVELFKDQTGQTITLNPDLYWDDFSYTQNKSLAEKVTAPAGATIGNNNGNAGIGNSNAKPISLVVPGKIKDPFSGKSLLAVATKFINLLLALIVIAAVVVIIIAGFRMVAGGGNPAQVTKAKKAILYAILGLAVALMSFAIVQIIQRFLEK